MAPPRTPESVTQEIQREREELASAVAHLRSDLKAATDVRAVLRSKWPQLAAIGTLAVGALAFRAVLRRRRREVTRARFGRFVVVERT